MVNRTSNKQQIQAKSNGKVLGENSNYIVTENNNVRTVLDKTTLETVTLTFTDSQHSKGTLKDIKGAKKTFTSDYNGNVYLDGERSIEAIKTAVLVNPLADNPLLGTSNTGLSTNASAGYTNPVYFRGANGSLYYYVTRYTTNTHVTALIQGAYTTLIGLLPGLAYVTGLYTIISTFHALSLPVIYIIQDQYCVSNYSNYAYLTYYYSDAAHTHLQGRATDYKQMW
ncbi:hypothetical protein [Clostridium estertheticum]|uniref:hypothetical protein n=1 Tax=Clostridium estertheticum TaxID=238834 RepID=UPI001C0D8C8D|nr:hypothetical protein [Clostridium estertheticum]MBU3187605.1 hypothetical protein [Clostridium estertheticum]